MFKAGAEEDIKHEKPVIERKREWEHGDGGLPDCARKQKPVFTAPEKIPGECRNWKCDNTTWNSKGIVHRIKADKKIVHREKTDA